MHDIRAIREQPGEFGAGLARRGVASARAIVGDLLARDRDLRALQVRLQQAQARRNEASRTIGAAKAQKDEERAAALLAEVAGLKEQLLGFEQHVHHRRHAVADAKILVPRIGFGDVPELLPTLRFVALFASQTLVVLLSHPVLVDRALAGQFVPLLKHTCAVPT